MSTASQQPLAAGCWPIYHEPMHLGMSEVIFILLLALVVVGPKKLPELGRHLGKFLAEFKRASNEFKNQLEAEMLNIELEERAKKQAVQGESPKVLPPEEPWERLMRPLNESVSRTKQELVGILNPESAPAKAAEPSSVAESQTSSSIKSPGGN